MFDWNRQTQSSVPFLIPEENPEREIFCTITRVIGEGRIENGVELDLMDFFKNIFDKKETCV